MNTIRLTSLSHGAGCACKLGPAELAQVLRHVPQVTDSTLLVDASTKDDAAVYRLSPDRALVATVDFFTPIVDDAADWGAIAAANSMSDVYAMGGTPLLALNIAAYNPTAVTYITTWPNDEARPTTSTLNPRAGVNVANLTRGDPVDEIDE